MGDGRMTGGMDEVFESVADYMKLLAVPTRLKVLHCICEKERSVGDIVDESGLTQTNVSRQLRGNLVYYQLSDPTLLEICHAVCASIAGRIEGARPLKKSLLKLMGSYR
jgi:DNA-binding transcriptional ArsR family regulator